MLKYTLVFRTVLMKTVHSFFFFFPCSDSENYPPPFSCDSCDDIRVEGLHFPPCVLAASSLGAQRLVHRWLIAFPRQSARNIHWKDWCWSWNSNTLATWCEELTHWKRSWCWDRLKKGEGDDRGWDGWMASLTRWTWVWVNSLQYSQCERNWLHLYLFFR